MDEIQPVDQAPVEPTPVVEPSVEPAVTLEPIAPAPVTPEQHETIAQEFKEFVKSVDGDLLQAWAWLKNRL